jgi:DsbC/DsbD-like thiol-disulfide interchange protein
MLEYGRIGRFYMVFAFCAGLLVRPAGAQAVGTPIPHGTIELLSENSWVGAGHSFYLGMHFQLESGWHVYWVNPGDSGQPPRVIWKLPAGISAGPIEWPVPKRLGTSRIVDYGYEDEVTLLVPMRAAGLATNDRAQIGAEVKVLVCREICTPGKAQLSVALPIRSEQPKPDARTQELFAAARQAQPQMAPGNWRFDAADEKDSFVLTANLGYQVKRATFFPLEESQIDNAAPQNPVAAAGGFRLTLRKSDQLLKPIERLRGVLELSPGKAFLIDVPVGKRGAGSSD